ncbi:N-acetyltransferase [Chitinophaga silvatica]|uniref:N-acetyltransferase n=1 Tax=Chitinophaga silvatica TaxID=2282649 RepID=A0A3E1YET8_9BACT|nr:GNAT family N-acetyltransferase [Chitinophaga silvatica]RFS25055.1 N-acetyltransferase [Chitinophaga silvatica]
MNTVTKGEYSITTDKTRFDLTVIHNYLANDSYWAQNIPMDTVVRMIEGSLCFGVFHQDKQIGFARMITDKAVFAYLADVFILPEARGQGLSKWLMETMLQHPDLQGLRRILLVTSDAHGLYAKYGFEPIQNPEKFMNLHNPDVYTKK